MKLILTFHSLDDDASVLSYPTRLFSKLIEALLESDMPILSLDDLLSDKSKSGVCITFDDGMSSLYKILTPLLKDYQFPAHLFLTTAAVGKNNLWRSQPQNAPAYQMLTWQQIEELYAAGLLIEAHTHNHPFMSVLNKPQWQSECLECNRQIEQNTGRKPQFFSYPYGDYNKQLCDFISQEYMASVTTKLAYLHKADHRHLLPRVDSYYLQHPWLFNNLAAPFCQAYIKARCLLREIKGSQ